MATSINVRLSDELEENLKNIIEEVRHKTPLGAEVGNSTVVRGALQDFINKVQDEKKGIKNISYNLSEIQNEKELERFNKLLDSLIKVVKDSKFSDKGISEKLLLGILTKIKIDSLNHKIKFI